MRTGTGLAVLVLALALACGGAGSPGAGDPGEVAADAGDGDGAPADAPGTDLGPTDPGVLDPGTLPQDLLPGDPGLADAPLDAPADTLHPLDVPGGYAAVCGKVPTLGPQGNHPGQACTDCADRECCDAAAACAGDLVCLVLRQCLAACNAGTDPACAAACASTYAGGVSSSDAVSACLTESCRVECADRSCLGEPWPTYTPGDYTFTVRLASLGPAVPKSGTIKVCRRADTACATPYSQSQVTDGQAQVKAPAFLDGIDAYLEIAATDFVPGLAYLLQPDPVAAFTGSVPLRVIVVKEAWWKELAKLVDVTLDPARGSVVFLARGCGDAAAAGVKVQVTGDDAATLVYLNQGTQEPGRTETSADGAGLVYNLPAGPVTLTATYAADGAHLGVAEAQVRPGTLTFVNIVPTPQ